MHVFAGAVALRALVREGRAKDVLIPDDLIARAPEILKSVAATFPAKANQYVAGPILQLGWGRPVSIVTMTAGIVFTFPNPVAIVIIGQFRIAVPEPDAAIIDLRADFAGIINATTGDVSFDASLTGSRIAAFDVNGDIALRAGPQGFVFTAGGFHPLFVPPADLATIRRLIAPQENARDLTKLPTAVSREMEIIFAANITKVSIRNVPWGRFHGLSIAPDDPVPSVAIARIGEQADCDTVTQSESRRRKIFMQGSAMAVDLIEAPE